MNQATVIEKIRVEDLSRKRTQEIPEGPTERHQLLKMNYLRQRPTISIHQARAITH